jgi:hypothetical protein
MVASELLVAKGTPAKIIRQRSANESPRKRALMSINAHSGRFRPVTLSR